MSGFQITITDAGRAALINAQNTGTVAFVLSQIGVSTQAIAGDLAGLTALPNERKRLATMAGDVVADDTLHVTIRDESADVYALRSFGLYASTGVLFAVYSQADPILEKSAAAMLLLAVDARLVALGTANVEFGPVGFTLPPASETIAGVVEIATDAEVDAGQDPWRVITARTLKRALGALSNFALKDHRHDAADVETGTFHANRIPELPMSRIAGLVATLADKASALHSHTIAQVSGLTAAIADIWNAVNAKANADGANLTGIARVAAFFLGAGRAYLYPAGDGINIRVGPVGAEHYFSFTSQGNVLLNGGPMWHLGNFNPDSKATLGEQVRFNTVSFGSGRGHIYGDGDRVVMRVGSQGAECNFGFNTDGGFQAYNGNIYSQHGRVWDPDNFNPNTKANTDQPSFSGQIHLISGSAQFRAIGDGDSLFLQAGSATSAYGNMILSGLYGNDLTSLRVQIGGALRDVFHTGIFNPASKVDIFNTDGYPHAISLGWNGERMVARVDNAAATPGHALVHLNDAASAAEAAAGASTNRFITPAALWSFARSIGPNGYQHIPGTDLIIQWGVSNGSHPEGAVHAALPVAFGGGCLFACATPRNAGQAYGMDFVMQIVGRYLDRIVFYANRANSSSGNMSGYEWMAVGLARGNPDPVYSTGYPPGGGGGGGEDPFFRPEV